MKVSVELMRDGLSHWSIIRIQRMMMYNEEVVKGRASFYIWRIKY